MATVDVVATPIQILAGTTVTLSAQFYSDGTVANPGVTTVGIVDSAGASVVAAGTATGGATTGPRTYALSDTTELDTLTVTWTTASLGTVTTTHEIVGAFLFSVAEARAFDGAAMANTTTYPTTAIEEARARLTDEFEEMCGVSFIPRYRVDVLSGDGGFDLMLPRLKVRDIRSVEYRDGGTATWTSYTADDLADIYIEDYGWINRESRGTFLTGRRNLRVGYEHGFSAPPLDIKRAALMAARYELVRTNINDRAISISTEQGSEQLWTPGLSGRGTAIHPLPEVDRILKLHNYRIPVVA
jgi:hypothetical protein